MIDAEHNYNESRFGVTIWDSLSDTVLLVLEGHTGIVASAAFSPDAKQIVTASYDGTARIWNSETGAVFRVLEGHNELVVSAVFSPDAKHIVTASYDGTARIWNSETGNTVSVL